MSARSDRTKRRIAKAAEDVKANTKPTRDELAGKLHKVTAFLITQALNAKLSGEDELGRIHGDAAIGYEARERYFLLNPDLRGKDLTGHDVMRAKVDVGQVLMDCQTYADALWAEIVRQVTVRQEKEAAEKALADMGVAPQPNAPQSVTEAGLVDAQGNPLGGPSVIYVPSSTSKPQ